MAEAWATDLVRTELTTSRESGTTELSAQAIRETCGLGPDDLDAALDVLRSVGQAIEVAPGLWRAVFPEDPEARAMADGEEPVEEPEADPVGEPSRVPRIDRGRRVLGVVEQVEPARGTVRLTMAVAKSLDEATLGKLVRAGIDEADGAGGGFVFEVF